MSLLLLFSSNASALAVDAVSIVALPAATAGASGAVAQSAGATRAEAAPAETNPAEGSLADAISAHGPWSGSRVVPNPLRTEAQVAFATARDGPLSVGIFDLGGRRVRTLLEEAGAPTGLHVIAFDGRGDDGARLRSGLYFYRIRSADGLRSGRFVIAR